MKVLIVDDEKHVRDGLRLLGNWEHYGIDHIIEATDGEEAKRLILEHQPEIIFTDMNMPKLDGIGLLKWISDYGINSKTIVVSGYDDFQYMRNAIACGSVDYLLKPIEPDHLNEVLDKAVREWMKQALVRQSTIETERVMNEIRPLYWDHLFSSIIKSQDSARDAVKKIEKEFGICLSKVPCTIALLSITPLLKKFEGDKELTYFTLLNISNEFIWRDNGIAFRNVNVENEIVILLWKKEGHFNLLTKINEACLKFCEVQTMIAVGETSDRLDHSYWTAHQTLLKYNLAVTKGKRIVSQDETSQGQLLHLLDYSQDFVWAIQSGSVEQVDAVLDKIFKNLLDHKFISLEQLNIWDEQFKVLRENWLKEYNIKEKIIVSNENNYWTEDGLFSFKSFQEEKRKEFHELIQFLNAFKDQKDTNSIQEIERFLRKNYDKEITLQDISNRFYLSREYISRRFKQEYHETITNYLTKIRMEKAKKLLENPHFKVYEVAFKVGYQNEKYFSKVFKKASGLTPNEYRQLHLQK